MSITKLNNLSVSALTALPSGVGGKVLQVVQATKTDTFSSTSASFVDVTDLSASITPSSASNKIIMIVSVPVGLTTRGIFKLVRNSTDILVGNSAGSRVPSNYQGYGDSSYSDGYYGMEMFSFSVVDSPSTTSSTTYKVQARIHSGGSGTVYVNRQAFDPDSNESGRGASTIILMEIAS